MQSESLIKAVFLTRVIQVWRLPIFQRLEASQVLDVQFWYGPDFEGTKVVSAKRFGNIRNVKLLSFRIKLNSRNGVIAMPFSPFLFFKLVICKPDVVVSEGASNLINALIGFVYCKIFKKKFVWWSLGKVVNRNYDLKRSFVDRLVVYLERNSDRILTYSSEGMKYFRSIGIEEDQIVVAVNVIDTDSKLLEIANRKVDERIYSLYKNCGFKILFVGAITKEKDIDKLLFAQKQLNRLGLNTTVIILGDGPFKKDLIKLSEDLNIINVDFIDGTFENSFDYFSMADLFVLPGLGGLAISEAMCFGLPVIASIGDGCEVDLVTEENGIVDRNMTAEMLTSYIMKFYVDSDFLISCGRNSSEKIRLKYNTSNYVNKLIQAISFN